MQAKSQQKQQHTLQLFVKIDKNEIFHIFAFVFNGSIHLYMQYSMEQILALATDAAAAKAGMQLATAAKWLKKYVHPLAIWGECQGSAKEPYRTAVDLSNLAFKCSCPSKKFPCKHSLGLLLLYAKQSDQLMAATELPEDIAEWLQKRNTKNAAKPAAADKTTATPVNDEAAKQKRWQAREKKIAAGIEELQTWLKDTIRTGIVTVAQQPQYFTQHIIARMNDAQATGLAAQLKKINQIAFHEDGWQKQLTKRLSKIYLFTEAYKNKAHFDAATQEDLDLLIGKNKSKEEVLNEGNTQNDTWWVLAKTSETEDNLITVRTWLYGISSGRFALLLDFAVKNQMPALAQEESLLLGSTLCAELVFYPYLYPLRVLIKQKISTQAAATADLPKGISGISALKEYISVLYAYTPFIETIPCLLQDVHIVQHQNKWHLKDIFQKNILLANTETECWKITAFSKGKDFWCFVLYENEQVRIMALAAQGQFLPL